MMSHALILAPFAEGECARLATHMRITSDSWLASGRIHDPEELGRRLAAHEVTHLVIEADFVFEETLELAPVLSMIGLSRNALNHVDLDAATNRGVLVVNTPGRNAAAVAELTLAMLLSLARRVHEANTYVKSGQWVDPVAAYGQFRGTELAGKTAGIIGFGSIGRMVARRLAAMDMRLLAHDPFVSREVMAAALAAPASLDSLLSESDFVLVHAPAMAGTMDMLGAAELARMKPTAYLVNTSAAGVCSEAALVEALEKGRIAGAGLDVFDGQPLPASSKLLCLPNVLLTPHIGGATVETIERYSRMIADDFLRVEDGLAPERLVNPEAWHKRRRPGLAP